MKNCSICTKPFSSPHPNRKTCSEECSHLALSAASKKHALLNESHIPKIKELMEKGMNNPEIAKELGVALPTFNNFKKKYNVKHTPEQIQAIRDRASTKRRTFDENGKICASCKETKTLDLFHKAENRASGVTDYCKECSKKSYAENPEPKKQRTREWAANNKEKKKQMDREYYLNNAEKFIARANNWRNNNLEKARESARASQSRHQKQKNARTSAYRATKRNATPAWVGPEEIKSITEFFKNCPPGYHVDHVYPIQGENVCGLHVLANLQYIPEEENETKANSVVDNSVDTCHQYKRRIDTEKEDRDLGMPFNLKASQFNLQYEPFTQEHADFIKRYEWMGTIGTQPKWTYTARYNGLLAGVVMIGEPDAFTTHLSRELQAQIKRGACASWAPKNLNSRLVMFAIRETVKRSEKRAFYAYSDYEAGEIGTIYQACNFIFLGKTYGAKTKFVRKDGKELTSRYFTKTSTRKRYAKELGIAVDKGWFCEKGYMKTEKIPEDVLAKFEEKRYQEIGECKVVAARPKGKYLYILGVDNKETKEIKKEIEGKITKYGYEKRK